MSVSTLENDLNSFLTGNPGSSLFQVLHAHGTGLVAVVESDEEISKARQPADVKQKDAAQKGRRGKG
jgi:hypothetical protein